MLIFCSAESENHGLFIKIPYIFDSLDLLKIICLMHMQCSVENFRYSLKKIDHIKMDLLSFGVIRALLERKYHVFEKSKFGILHP